MQVDEKKKQKKWIIIRDGHKNWQERKYYKISLRRLWILEEVEFNSSSIIKFILSPKTFHITQN